jgi:hypothetical protein
MTIDWTGNSKQGLPSWFTDDVEDLITSYTAFLRSGDMDDTTHSNEIQDGFETQLDTYPEDVRIKIGNAIAILTMKG